MATQRMNSLLCPDTYVPRGLINVYLYYTHDGNPTAVAKIRSKPLKNYLFILR